MTGIRPIIEKRSYGKVVFHFNKIMDDREITRAKLSSLSGMRFEVVNRLYHGNIERLDIDILARFCSTLKCKVSDVIEYIE